MASANIVLAFAQQPIKAELRVLTSKPIGKFRPWLIELISFNPKLLIRFIMNKRC